MGDCFATLDMGRGLRMQTALPASVNCKPYLRVPVVNYLFIYYKNRTRSTNKRKKKNKNIKTYIVKQWTAT